MLQAEGPEPGVKGGQANIGRLSQGGDPCIGPEIRSGFPPMNGATEGEFMSPPLFRNPKRPRILLESVPRLQGFGRRDRRTFHHPSVGQKPKDSQPHRQAKPHRLLLALLPPLPGNAMVNMALDQKREDHIDINQRGHRALENSSSARISSSSLLVLAGILRPAPPETGGLSILLGPLTGDLSALSKASVKSSFKVIPLSCAAARALRKRGSGSSIVVRIHKYAHIWSKLSNLRDFGTGRIVDGIGCHGRCCAAV